MPNNTAGRTQSDYESVYLRVKSEAPDYEMLLPSPEEIDILSTRHTPLDAQKLRPVCEMILVHVFDDWFTGEPGVNISKAIHRYVERLPSEDERPITAVRKAAALLAWTYIRLDNDSDDAKLLLSTVIEATPANDGGRTLPTVLRQELEVANKDRWKRSTTSVPHIFERAELADIEFLLGCIESPTNFTDDKTLKTLFETYQTQPTPKNKGALLGKLEREIRYLGSSDIAYLVRWAFSREGGVHIAEVVDDVAKKLKVRVPDGVSIETKLERIVRSALFQQFWKMTPDQQRGHFDRLGVDRKVRDDIVQQLARDGVQLLLPILFKNLGKKAVAKVATNVVMEFVFTKILGRKLATQIIKEMAITFPWWSEWIGPIAWTATGVWLAIDLLGPAYRKTVALVLYLGVVMLRDGPEEGDSFWQEPESAEP